VSRQVTIEGRVVQETPDAVLIRVRDMPRREEIWFPRKVLLDGDTLSLSDSVCAAWFAKKMGLT